MATVTYEDHDVDDDEVVDEVENEVNIDVVVIRSLRYLASLLENRK